MPGPSEHAMIDEVRRRLIAKYSHLAPAEVVVAVSEAEQRFVDSRIRDFVPLLVERRANKALSECAGPVTAAH
jgi:precorrin-4 methylase